MSSFSFNPAALRLELLGSQENSPALVNLPPNSKQSIHEIASAIEGAILQLKKVRFSAPQKFASRDENFSVSDLERRLTEAENRNKELENEVQEKDLLISELQRELNEIKEKSTFPTVDLIENSAEEFSSPAKSVMAEPQTPSNQNFTPNSNLERSAVSIQSAYRSFLERQGVERERELRELPIASPSRGFGKNRKISRLSLIEPATPRSEKLSKTEETENLTVHSDNPGSITVELEEKTEQEENQPEAEAETETEAEAEAESPASGNSSINSASSATVASNPKRILAEF